MKKILLFLLLAVGIGGVAGYYLYNKPPENYKNAKADFQVSPSELVKAFTNNEQEANTKYGGKLIGTKGSIVSIDKASDGSINILLDSGDPMSTVMCQLDPNVDQNSAGLQVGQSISILGECTGFTTDVVLDRCVLIN